MTEVNEKYVTSIGGMQIILSEHAIVKCYCSAFINESGDVEFCNLCGINQCFSLDLSVIRWNREYCLSVSEFVDLDNVAKFADIGTYDLFSHE